MNALESGLGALGLLCFAPALIFSLKTPKPSHKQKTTQSGGGLVLLFLSCFVMVAQIRN